MKQVNQPAEASPAPTAAEGQKLPQETVQSDHAVPEAKESAEAPVLPPSETKKANDAPLAASGPDKPVTQFEQQDAASKQDEPDTSQSSSDDISAYSQYLDAAAGKSGSSEQESTSSSHLTSQAMEAPKQRPPSEQPAPV